MGPAGLRRVRAHGEALFSLAEAVARRPRALLVGSDNRSKGWVTLGEAIAQALSGDGTFAVEVADALLAVDLDLDVDGFRREAAFGCLVKAVTSAGGHPLVWASGRPGHRHLLARLAHGPNRAGVEAWAREHGLDARRVIRPPLAPHRSGHPVALVSESSVAGALAALSAPVDPEVVLAGLGRQRLSPRMRATLRHGHEAGGYPSPSEGRMALALALRGSGGSPSLLRTLLGDEGNRLGATFRRRSSQWQAQEVSRLWARAGDYLAREDDRAASARRGARAWCRALAQVPWVGMGGASELALAEAIGRRALEGGRRRILFPLATSALGAGVSISTARRGLRRLVAKGWLALVEAPGPRSASVWELRVPGGLDVGSDKGTEKRALPWEAASGDLGADMARWGGLGKSTVRVLRAVASGTGDPAVLAERLGVGLSTVRAHLRKLKDAGLVACEKSSWRALDHDPDAVARRFGTAGRRSADEGRYAEARLVRREAWMAHRPRDPRRGRLWPPGHARSSSPPPGQR